MNSENLKNKINEVMVALSVDEQTAQQFVQLKQQKEGLERYFETYPEDNEDNRFNQNLKAVEQQLDHTRSYRIAIIGATGAGKSSVANALLDRDLLPAQATNATTGTVLEIHQKASNSNDESATLIYRSESNVLELIKTNFIKRFQMEEEVRSEINSMQTINENLKNTIDLIEPSSENDSDAFEKAKKIYTGIVDQFIQQSEHPERRTFNLNDPSHLKQLNSLIDENSQTNQHSRTRQIELIEKVSYYISTNEALDIPNTACLIDLPGLGATQLHDDIINKNVEGADAVVFVFDTPTRIERQDELDLMIKVINNISIKSAQIFLVFNKWDQLVYNPTDQSRAEDAANSIAKKLGLSLEDKSWYFPVSATMARVAEKNITNPGGELLENYELYAKHSGSANPADPKEVLEKTGIPKLAKALSALAKNNVPTRIKDATDTLNSILDTLEEMHQPGEELPNLEEKLLDETGRSNDKEFENMQEMMLKSIDGFTAHQLVKRSDLKRELESKFDAICTSVNEELQRACPGMWKSIRTDRDKLRGRRDFSLAKKAFITKANITVWHLLSKGLVGLAEKAAEYYRKEFSEEQVLETLIEDGKNLQLTKEAFSQESIKTGRKKLKENLSQATNRSAVAILCDPEHFFLEEEELQVQESGPGDESNQQHSTNSERSKLGELVENLWDDEETNEIGSPQEEKFEEIVECVARIYTSLVKDDIIDGLLNIYLYESTCIVEMLEGEVEKLIRDLRRERILEPLSGDESKDVKNLREKIKAEKLREEKREVLKDLKKEVEIRA